MLTAPLTEEIQQLSLDKATTLIRRAIKSARSEDGIRAQLNTAGFDGSRANIHSEVYEKEGFFIALVTVKSPLGVINVSITNSLR